jgi:hypothetical protein
MLWIKTYESVEAVSATQNQMVLTVLQGQPGLSLRNRHLARFAADKSQIWCRSQTFTCQPHR